MADAETLLNLKQDEPAVAAFLVDNGGRLDRDAANPSIYWLTMRPLSAPDERYHARLGWTVYPYAAPSVKFADSRGGRLDVATAWPIIPGYRPQTFDICKPMCSEGFLTHPEWVEGPEAWPTEGNPFLWVVGVLQYDLDNQYSGRFK
jgi:hypothetical protein